MSPFPYIFFKAEIHERPLPRHPEGGSIQTIQGTQFLPGQILEMVDILRRKRFLKVIFPSNGYESQERLSDWIKFTPFLNLLFLVSGSVRFVVECWMQYFLFKIFSIRNSSFATIALYRIMLEKKWSTIKSNRFVFLGEELFRPWRMADGRQEHSFLSPYTTDQSKHDTGRVTLPTGFPHGGDLSELRCLQGASVFLNTREKTNTRRFVSQDVLLANKQRSFHTAFFQINAPWFFFWINAPFYFVLLQRCKPMNLKPHCGFFLRNSFCARELCWRDKIGKITVADWCCMLIHSIRCSGGSVENSSFMDFYSTLEINLRCSPRSKPRNRSLAGRCAHLLGSGGFFPRWDDVGDADDIWRPFPHSK